MHEFFMVSTTWIYRERLKWLERNYGLAAIGFYWKAVAQIGLSGGSTSMSSLMALRGRGMRMVHIQEIVEKSGLFTFGKDSLVELIESDENGLHKQIKKDASRTSAPTGAPASAPASAQTGAQARTSVKREDIDKEQSRECAREEIFYRFMQTRCPNLLLMPEPLTLDQFLALRQDYSTEAIQDVLLDMENHTALHARNCYYTARRWLEHRQKN